MIYKLIIVALCGLLMTSCTRPPRPNTNTATVKNAAAINAPVAIEKKKQANDLSVSEKAKLSPASRLMIKACDNYLGINPTNSKIAEVLLIKGSVYYNSGVMEESRKVYKEVMDKESKGPHVLEAIRMIAQSFYEEKRFDEAQSWYRKFKDVAGEGGDKQEAIVRIAESIFKIAEAREQEQRFLDAAGEYERVALEFPDSKIADVSLFNAGLAYEKNSEWSRSILMYQRMLQKYPLSKLLVKGLFRSAKCYEKLLQWDNAGQSYLRVVANYPQSDLAPVSLYNAGFCFENAGKLEASAATFEKLAALYPKSEEVADVLFKAGEIYGKIKDWAGVTRVNQEFSKRFGSDVNRIVQAQCMVGVALYMQNRQTEALSQLQQTITTYIKLKNTSAANKYYAAKAEFTIAEINLEAMNKIALPLPKDAYKKQLGSKSDALDKAIASYSKVIGYQISEWTTRSVFQIGQAYEDFALGIFKQERQKNASLDERLALELGIAKAVDEYCVGKATHYHEQNIKLGIKEKIEDKYILLSRKKITSLPLMAGEKYLALVDIAQSSTKMQKLEGFALIARKLDVLQKIAPFQERAIELFLKCLELGSSYQQTDEFFTKASGLITKQSFTVGETYSDVATIARDAPIPPTFDAYEAFVYKTKLLKQIEGYEDKALENYLRTVKIAEAYSIDDDFVKRTRQKIPEVLFIRGRCYDLLCQNVVNDPPFPKNASDAEKEEYRGRFGEIGMRFQDNAIDIYKTILDDMNKKYATGTFVSHAYVRLFQIAPNVYGIKKDTLEDKIISTGPEWKCSVDSAIGWISMEFNDQTWQSGQKGKTPGNLDISGFPGKAPFPLWYGEGDPKSQQNYKPVQRLFLRRTFNCPQVPQKATLYCAAIDQFDLYLNGALLPQDTSSKDTWYHAQQWNLVGKLREGKNVIALFVRNGFTMGYGAFPYLSYSINGYEYVPQLPGALAPMDPKLASEKVYNFPAIKNFQALKQSAAAQTGRNDERKK